MTSLIWVTKESGHSIIFLLIGSILASGTLSNPSWWQSNVFPLSIFKVVESTTKSQDEVGLSVISTFLKQILGILFLKKFFFSWKGLLQEMEWSKTAEGTNYTSTFWQNFCKGIPFCKMGCFRQNVKGFYLNHTTPPSYIWCHFYIVKEDWLDVTNMYSKSLS